MKKPFPGWNAFWRTGLCLILLYWILQSIFLSEAEAWHQARGLPWDNLPLGERLHAAWTIGPPELWSVFRLISVPAFLLAFVFMGTTIFLGVIRWRIVLRVQGLFLSFGRVLEIALIGHFFNSLLLGATGGDLLKAFYVARETAHKKAEAVVTVVADRLVGLLAMLLFAVLMMLPNLGLVLAHRRLSALSLVVLTMFLGCAFLLVLSFWGGLSRHWPQPRRWLRKLPKGDLLERALDASRTFGKQPKFLLETVIVSMVLNVMCVFQVYTLSRGLGLQVGLLPLLMLVPMIICIASLPITPSGLGVRENLFVWTLAIPQFGVPGKAALAVSLLAYAGSLLWSFVGAVVYIFLRETARLPALRPEDDPDVSWTP